MSFLAHFAPGDQPSGAFFLPFLEGLAAAMENRMPAALTVDATLWANAMPRAARLVEARGIAVGVLPMIAAESFGVTVMREGADASVVSRPDAPAPEPWLVAPMANLLEDLHAAIAQLPKVEYANEAKPLQEELERSQRRRGPQPLSEIIPIVLARLGMGTVQSTPEGQDHS